MFRIVQKVLIIAGLVIFALNTVGCGSSTPTGGRTLTIVQGPEPFSLDPTQEINKTGFNVQFSIFDPLVKVEPDGKVQPWLATEWRSVDSTKWQLTLRKGVKFHNGEEFNAESVVFSIKAYNSSKGEGSAYFQFIKDARVVDESTVELVTETPNPATLASLGFLMALPPKYYAKVGPEEFSANPVGTGPYGFVSWQKGISIELKENTHYWNGSPAYDKVVYKPAPEASTRVAMLETGDADIVANVPPELVGRIESSGRGVIRRVPSLRILFVEFNMKSPPFNDVRVRQAANLAVDKDAIVGKVLGGNAERRIGVIPPGWVGSNPISALARYDYNPEEAKRLLREAGYEDGVTVDFWYPVGRYLKDKEVAETIAYQLEQVGIKCNMHGMDIGSLIQKVHTQTLSGMHLYSWAPLIMDTDNLWRAHFYTKGLNQYAVDAKTDDLLIRGASTLELAERERLYSELERYVVNDLVPWIFLYAQSLIYGVSKDVEWQPRADEIIDVRTITPVQSK